MSLFLATDVFTFVPSKKNHLHFPMDRLNTYLKYSSKRQFLPKALLLAASMFLCSVLSFGQGWEIYFGGNAEDFGNSVIQAKNHDYLLAGFSESFGDGDMDVYVIRTDVDGRKIWEKTYDEGHIEHGYSIIETDDNAFLVVGDIINTPLDFQFNAYLLKISNQGELLWSTQYGGPENDTGYRVIPSANDGGYLIVGKTSSFGNGGSDVYLVKVDADGNTEWSNTYGGTGSDIGRSVVEVADGYLITGSAFNENNNSADLYLLKIDFAGNEQWSKFFGTPVFDEGQDLVTMDDGNFAIVGNTGNDAYLLKVSPDGNEIWSTTFGGPLGTIATDLLKAPNGDLVFTGVVEVDAENSDAFLARFDSDGNEVWNETVGRSSYIDWAQSLAPTNDKGFVVAGYNAEVGIFVNDVTLIKAGANGSVYTNHITGKIFIDEDGECDLDTGEEGLNEWIVEARSAANTFYGTSDSLGNYEITVDLGAYNVSVFNKNNYWLPCVAAYNVSFNAPYDTLIRNFPILKDTLCPLLEVDVSTPSVQNCSNIGYTVNYCNNGTVGVGNPSIEIILDNELQMTGSPIPFTFTPDSLYVFELDSIGIDECGSFYFSVASTCNGQPAQAYTVSAHILPDSICTTPSPTWDRSNVKVNGYCETDSVYFEIKNDGDGDMEEPLEFIIIEDQILGRQGEFKLAMGSKKKIGLPVNGATYRIIAEQSPGHPGNSYPTKAVEGCSTGNSFSTGYTTQLQEDENDPFVSIDVQEAISSATDYIFMRGYPSGYLENGNHLIPANTPLQYHIYFQNAGTDTVQRLVIRDTLPASLDLGTVVPGASSHPYRFEAYSNGVLKFTFEDLNLSSDGDTASTGFLQFKVSQKPNNPRGTIIPNSAAVFLGYDAPAQTATTVHVVDSADVQTFIITDVSGPLLPGVEVNAYPNPFTSTIVFEIPNSRFNHLTLTVFDRSGLPVRREKASGNLLQLKRGNLLAGLYAYQLEANGRLLHTGKIIVR